MTSTSREEAALNDRLARVNSSAVQLMEEVSLLSAAIAEENSTKGSQVRKNSPGKDVLFDSGNLVGTLSPSFEGFPGFLMSLMPLMTSLFVQFN